MLRISLFLLPLIFVASDAVSGPLTPEDQAYLERLVHEAQSAKLHQHPKWRALIHYEDTLLGGWVSQVDGSDFFMAGDGKTNPQGELEATLASFFSDEPLDGMPLAPRCRFIARFAWLDDQLGFDPRRLSSNDCRYFNRFRDGVRAGGLTVVFPSAHPNNPSSMFGHTLLRLDRPRQTKATKMLSFSVNYAARVGEVSPLDYAVRGMTGGFPGRFDVLPYHMKLREYGQMENRDIWEYRLKLTPEQTQWVLMHAYELIPTYFDYYFFTENCSYHLLSLLDVVFPEDPLTDEFPAWTIPIDTLKALQQRGLIEAVAYEPAQNRLIQAKRAQLDPTDRELAMALFRDGLEAHTGQLSALPVQRRSAVLDLTYEYLRYDRMREAHQLDAKLSLRERQVLSERSRLRVASRQAVIPRPEASPESGHDSARLAVGGGRDDNGSYGSIEWRAAYHDLLDPTAGFVSGYGLDFLDLEARYLEDEGELRLERFKLLELVSLTPRDRFFRNISWHARGQWERIPTDQGRRPVTELTGGPGLAYRLGTGSRAVVYGLADGEAAFGETLDQDYSLGAGLSAGLLSGPLGPWRGHLSGRFMQGLLGDTEPSWRVALEQSVALGKQTSLRLDLAHRERFGQVWDEMKLRLHYYF